MSKYIIGVDGGGTKALGILFDEFGNEERKAVSGFANFSVDPQATITHLHDVLEILTYGIPLEDIIAIQIGIAGYSNFTGKVELMAELQKLYPTSIQIVTDAEIALYSVKQDHDCNVIMALGGTGSVVMVEQDEKISFIGGFGHLLGDEGSGYHLSITALKKIIDQFEKGLPESKLSKAILKEIGASQYSEIKNFVYNNKKKDIAKLSEFIAKHAIEGDNDAKSLVVQEGKLLAEQALRAYATINNGKETLIGLKGGFLLNAPYVKDVLMEELDRTGIKYRMDESSQEPVKGAYFMAKRRLNER